MSGILPHRSTVGAAVEVGAEQSPTEAQLLSLLDILSQGYDETLTEAKLLECFEYIHHRTPEYKTLR